MGVLYKCVICSEESTHIRIVNGKRYCIGCENLYDNFYAEIKSSILTPKVVALLKAIGSKPTRCHECDYYDGKWDCCSIIYKGANYYRKCPLLTSEELKELTE